MLQAFVIALREGLEAFLVVAIVIAFLQKAGRTGLVRVAWLAVATSIALSIGLGWLFGQAENRPLWEGVLAIVAAATALTLTVQMFRAGRRMRGHIEGALLRRLDGPAAALAVFGFVTLMITREGMETALLMSTLLFQVKEAPVVAGATLGLAAAAGVALAWTRWGHRVDLGRLFQVTGVFMVVFVLQLGLVGFHELSEAGVLPDSERLHWATEPYGPDGIYGQWFTYLLVAVPLGWLALSAWRARRGTPLTP
jgi:high-affinity iron transporter